MTDDVYSFLARGVLARAALDRATPSAKSGGSTPEEITAALSLDALDDDIVARARRMAVVYTAIAAFENSARELVTSVLVQAKGATWWDTAVSSKIREKAEARRAEEAKVRWHAQRGDHPLTYTDFGDLANIIAQNWPHFEAHLRTVEWTRQVFEIVERSRNVIMHSGELEMSDIERVGINLRDWVKQVGV